MDDYKSLTAIFAAPWEWASNSMTDGYWQLTTKTEGGKLTITAFKRLIAGVPILDLRKPVNGTDLPLGKSTETWQYDTSLKILRFADSMTYYGGAFCFRGCSSLAQVVLPANLTSTAKNGFYQCSALRTVTPLLPDSVATINEQSFSGNPLSGKLVVNNPSVKSLSSAFSYCSGLKEMDFSKSGLTTINEYCFRKCTSVTNIYFPATLNILAKDCLYQCNALRSVYLESKPATIHYGALEGVPSTMRLVIYKDDIDWMDHLAMCETNTTTPFVAWSNLSASVQSKYTFTDTRTCKPYGTVKLGSACQTVYIATRSRGIPGLLMLVR